jgi:hypothetical protein
MIEFFNNLSWPGAIAFLGACFAIVILVGIVFAAILLSNLEINFDREKSPGVKKP